MLRSGLIYPFGKDHEFRPIMIFNPEILDVSDVFTKKKKKTKKKQINFFFFFRKTSSKKLIIAWSMFWIILFKILCCQDKLKHGSLLLI